MKRKLAKEALYSSHSYDFHHQSGPCNVPAMQLTKKEQVQKADPHGDRALALLQEIENQRNLIR